jgi:hypothetical protein
MLTAPQPVGGIGLLVLSGLVGAALLSLERATAPDAWLIIAMILGLGLALVLCLGALRLAGYRLTSASKS